LRMEDEVSSDLEVNTEIVVEHSKGEEVYVDAIQVDVVKEKTAEINELAVDQSSVEAMLVQDFTEEVLDSEEMNEIETAQTEAEALVLIEEPQVRTEDKLESEINEVTEIETVQNDSVEES